MTLLQRAALAQQAARAAGELVSSSRDFRVMDKAEKDYVTEMDIKSEQLIREILLSSCPEDEFFGEESGGVSVSKGRWIVDPIDGTTNFVKGIALYTISIAYECDGELALGVVYCPRLDEMYVAISGMGATMNGETLKVNPITRLEDAVVGLSFAARNEANKARTLAKLPQILADVNDLRRMGSAAYDLCCVASGKYDGFFELGLHLYDIAAGVLIVREAGGVVTGWDEGDEVLESGNVIAAGALVHEYLRRTLGE